MKRSLIARGVICFIALVCLALPPAGFADGNNEEGQHGHQDRGPKRQQEPTTVPEPGTLALLGVGLACLIAKQRRANR